MRTLICLLTLALSACNQLPKSAKDAPNEVSWSELFTQVGTSYKSRHNVVFRAPFANGFTMKAGATMNQNMRFGHYSFDEMSEMKMIVKKDGNTYVIIDRAT